MRALIPLLYEKNALEESLATAVAPLCRHLAPLLECHGVYLTEATLDEITGDIAVVCIGTPLPGTSVVQAKRIVFACHGDLLTDRPDFFETATPEELLPRLIVTPWVDDLCA